MLVGRKLVVGANHLRHAGIAADLRAVTRDEIPIERVEGTGLRPGPLLHVVLAAAAIVGHAVDVGAARRIGLGGEQAAIGELAHAHRVRQLDPLIGVGIDRQIPFVQFVRIDPRQQREIAGDHQPLDVMGIGVLARLGHRRANAGHRGLARPVEAGQRPRVAKKVAALVARHPEPVDPADIFAPADDLPDEPFRRVQWHPPGAPLRLDPAANAQRIEQAAVEILRNDGVIEERFARQHRILEVTELRQSLFHEGLERGLGVDAGHGEAEGREVAEMIAEPRLDQRQHFLRHRIGHERRRPRHEQICLRGLAVLRIEVPAAAGGRVAVHQQPGAPAHLAIEILHPELLASLGPPREVGGRAQEALVGEDLHRQREALGP